MTEEPEDDARQDTKGPPDTTGHQASVAHPGTIPLGNVVQLIPASLQKRLEALDTSARRLHEQLSNTDETLAAQMKSITDELIGLRHDMAELFQEFKAGNMAAAAVVAYTTEVHVAELKRQDPNTRLNRLEELDQKDSDPGSR